MISTKFPLWIRVGLLSGIVIFATGAGLLGYWYYSRPVTLTVAVGSFDGEAAKVMTSIASRLVSADAPVRLKVVNTFTAQKASNALSAGDVDLAVVRSDVGDLSQVQTVVVVTHLTILIVAPPGSSIDSIEKLRGRTVGVVSGSTNSKIVDVLTKQYDLTRAKVSFKDVSLADARRAVEDKEVSALIFAIPLTEKYLSYVRSVFRQDPKMLPVLIPIDSAAAIADVERAYENFEVPKGTLRGAPAVPDDDVTTLRTTMYLVAGKKLNADAVTGVTQAIMSARRDLLAEQPILAQIAAPSMDSDAFLEIHPGAAAFFNGSQLGFMDKYGNQLFLAPMIIGGLFSVGAGAWRFLGAHNPEPVQGPVDSLYALGRRIRKVENETELSDIEDEIDNILRKQRAMAASGDENALDASTLNVVAHRLGSLIHDRRGILKEKSTVAVV